MDARLRGDWLGQPRFDDLSDRAWRVLTVAMMWSATQGTDGVVPRRYVEMALHPDGPQPAAVEELVAAGLAVIGDDASLALVGWSDDLGQATARQVAGRREKARERQQRRRDAARAARDAPMPVAQVRTLRRVSDARDALANVRTHAESDGL